ncbi:MAG: hypothetical protein KGK12_03280, partial [Armatimonadetes bacterium]|nr:hypothetical protein [Armatimonadota bacterium]
AGVAPTLASFNHPLVNFPYTISATQIQGLGQGETGPHHIATSPTGGLVSPSIVEPVVRQGSLNLPLVYAGDYGAGHLLISSLGVATGIAGYLGGPNIANEGPNTATITGTQLLGVRAVDLEFAINAVAWTSSITEGAVNARRAGGATETMDAALGEKWATIPHAGRTSADSGAVSYKNVVFWVGPAANGSNANPSVLHAFNANPGQDLDGDLSSDEGLVDYSTGTPWDEIWNYDLTKVNGSGTTTTSRVSTPTVISLANSANGLSQDLVAVTNSVGVTMAFQAFPGGSVFSSVGQLAWTTSALYGPGPDISAELSFPYRNQSAGSGDPNQLYPDIPAPAPVLSEGVLFAIAYVQSADVNHSWRVAAIDPATGANIFGTASGYAPFSTPGVIGLPTPTGPLSASYVRDDLTGAQDKMIMVPTEDLSNNTVTGAIDGLWFATRDEPLVASSTGLAGDYSPIGNRAHVPWYAPTTGANTSLLPVVSVVTTNTQTGLVTNVTQLQSTQYQILYLGAPGSRNMVVRLSTPLNPPVGFTQTVSADYTVDWPDAPIGAGASVPIASELSLFSGTLPQYGNNYRLFSPNNAPNREPVLLSGAPAVSRNDLTIFGAGDYDNADRIYAYRPQFATGRSSAGYAVPYVPEIAWMFSPATAFSDGNTADFVPARFVVAPNTGVATPNNGAAPTAFYDFEMVGSPAVVNGTVYVAGWGHLVGDSGQGGDDVSIIAALREQPPLTFTIPNLPAGSTVSDITVSQVDVLQSSATNPRYIRVSQNFTNPSAPQRMTFDPTSGQVHMLNLYTPDGCLNTALPLQVTVVGSTGTNTVSTVRASNGFGPLDNCLWYVVIPVSGMADAAGDPVLPFAPVPPPPVGPPTGSANLYRYYTASGPSVVGNSLFVGMRNGYIVALPLTGLPTNGSQVSLLKDPTQLPSVQNSILTALPAIQNPATGIAFDTPVINPPLATNGTLLVGTPNGLSALDDQVTLIADSDRLLEVNHAGQAVWSLGSTRSLGVAGGTLVDSGQIITSKVPLANPNVAHHTSLETFVVAETGHNRVIQVDKGGIVDYEIAALRNDLHVLPPGSPLSLNAPTDVQVLPDQGAAISFTSPLNGVTYSYAGAYIAQHYLIADGGNYRIVEVEDAYNSSGEPVVLTGSDGSSVTMLDQVVYSTETTEQNQRLRYRTVQFFSTIDRSGLNPIAANYLCATVDNQRLAATDPGVAGVGLDGSNVRGPGGSLSLIHRYPATGAPYKDGAVAAVINSFQLPNGAIQAVDRPTWFKEVNVPGQSLPDYLLADANGVYELQPAGNSAKVVWMLSTQDYFNLTGHPLRATCIQRLGNLDYDSTNNLFYPRYLITNGYSGNDQVGATFGFGPGSPYDGRVTGEVVEVRSLEYYMGGYGVADALYTSATGALQMNPASAITWICPSESISNGKIIRSIGSLTGATSTSMLSQPTYSERRP